MSHFTNKTKILKLHNCVVNVLKSFENLLLRYNFTEIQCIVLEKILSNLTSALLLLKKEFEGEATIILRSAIESTIFFHNDLNKSKCKEIYQENNLQQFLCMIRGYNLFNAKSEKLKKIEANLEGMSIKEYKVKYINEIIKFFHQYLNSENQKKILKDLNVEEFIINDLTICKINKLLKKKPKYMNFNENLKDFEAEELDFYGTSFNTKNLIFEEYNEFSQILHGDIFFWGNDKRETIAITSYNLIVKLIVLILSRCEKYNYISAKAIKLILPYIDEYQNLKKSFY